MECKDSGVAEWKLKSAFSIAISHMVKDVKDIFKFSHPAKKDLFSHPLLLH